MAPEAERYRLFESVADVILSAPSEADVTGLLLCLDDLHWADRLSLLLLLHITRRLASHRVLTIATYRPEETTRSRSLSDVLAELVREGVTERLSLRRFSVAETAFLMESLSGRNVSSPVVEAIQHHTVGNPFFVYELTTQLLDDLADFSNPNLAVQ
jgi:predicted ATPase